MGVFRHIKTLEAENERLRKALMDIACQRRVDEATEEERAVADYEGAYDCCVRVARAAFYGSAKKNGEDGQ